MANPDLTHEALVEAIDRNDVEAVTSLFHGATDRQRAALRPLLDINRDLGRPVRGNDALTIAWLATAPARDAGGNLQWRLGGSHERVIAAACSVVLDRTAPFRSGFAKAALSPRSYWYQWDLLRAMARTGAIDPAAGDDTYVRALGIAIQHNVVDFDTDPELLGRTVWQLFEVPDAIEAWSDGLAALVASGRLDRDRLVDASLASLAMDRRPGDRRAMAQVAIGLELTDAELAARSEAVLGLCAGDPGTQLLAVEWLARLVAVDAVEPVDAAEALRTSLAGTKKNLAVAGLKLLDQIAADHPDAATAALVVAVSGFGHPQADISSRTLKLLQRRTSTPLDPVLAGELLSWIDTAPAVLRADIAELAGVDGLVEPPDDEPLVAIPAPRPPSPEARYTDDRRLTPIEGLDELVLTVARLLESEGTGDDYERALAAIGRLAGERPAGWDDLVSPIRKRAHGIIDASWIRSAAASGMARLTLAWTEGIVPIRPAIPEVLAEDQSVVARLLRQPQKPQPTIGWLLFDRIIELSGPVAAGTSAALWSEPTHRHGHLDPSILAERAGTTKALGPADTRIALLRTGHGSSPDRLLAVTDDAWPQWFAAPGDAPRDPLLARAIDVSTKGSPTRHTYPPKTWWDLGRGPDDAIGAGILCTRMDLAAARAAIELGLRLETNPATAEPGETLELIADPVVSFDQPMATLVALSLAASPRTRALAADVLITVIDDERVDAAVLAGQLSVMQERELVVLTRVVPPLVDVAAAGPVHRAVVLDVLLRTMVAVGTGAPGLHAVLEAAVELAGTSELALAPDQRAVLERLAGRTSKAAKAARSLLQSADR